MKIHHLLSICLMFIAPIGNHINALSSRVGKAKAAVSSMQKEDDDYTAREKNVVACPTTGLFSNDDKITIDFSKIGRNDWCYPMNNGRIISPYGGKRHHSGTDIKTFPGDTIYAAFDGRVRFAKSYFGYGNVIVLRHPQGFETLYAHNKKNIVRIGDYVKAGEPIAVVGRTGHATTEHCHFEVRINGKAYNPMQFFDGVTRQLRSELVIAHRSGKIETINVVPSYEMAEDKTIPTKTKKQRG